MTAVSHATPVYEQPLSPEKAALHHGIQDPQTTRPKPRPHGHMLVDFAEVETRNSDTPWTDPALTAVAEEHPAVLLNALNQDEINGYDNESPIHPIVKRIERRRSVAPNIAAAVMSVAAGVAVVGVFGAAKYQVGQSYNGYDDPIIPHNAIAFSPNGLPGFAVRDNETGTVEVGQNLSALIVLGASALTSYGIGIIGLTAARNIATSPSGIRRSAKKELDQQKKNAR